MTAPGAASPPPRDRSLLRESAIVAAASGLASGVAALRGLLGARALGPEGFGIWQGVRLILRLATYADLGLLDALRREVPLARGAGDLERADRVRGAAAAVMLAVAAAFALGCGAAACRALGRGERALAATLGAAGLAAALQVLSDVVFSVLRAEGRVARGALSTLAGTVVSAAAAWPLSTGLGPAGFALAVALGTAAGLACAAAGRGARDLAPRPSRAVALELVRAGLPIQAAGALSAIRRSVDKAIILQVSGAAAAGLYGLADTVAGLIEVAPLALVAALAPRALARFGRSRDPGDLADVLIDPLELTACLVPLAAGLAAIAAEVAIGALLPRFDAGVPALRILVLGPIWAGPERLGGLVAVALGRQRPAAILALAFAALAVLLDLLALRAGYGIEGVAIASVTVGAAHALALCALAIRWLGLAPDGRLRPVVRAFAMSLAGAGALVGVNCASGVAATAPGPEWRAIALVLLNVPQLFCVLRKGLKFR